MYMKNFSFGRLASLIMLLTVSASIQAYDFEVGGIYYNKDGSNAKVVSGDKKYENTVTIPEKVENDGVSYWVTSIGAYAFDNCDHLTKVTLSKELKEIGFRAFRNCIALADINWTDNIISLGEDAFIGCTSLTTVTLSAKLSDMGESAFSGCTGINSLTVHDGCTLIGGSAFYGCNKIQTVKLPQSVKRIGSSAFSGCTALEELNVGSGVETIASYAFDGCSHLKKVVLGSEVKYINFRAFRNCIALADVNWTDNIISLGEDAFSGCTSLTTVTLSAKLSEMGESAFGGCTAINSLTVHDGCTLIGGSAFSGCKNLKAVELPQSVVSVGGSALENCVALTTVRGGDALQTLGSYAFSGCTHLQDFTVGGDLRQIGFRAFRNCTSLTNLTILTATPPTLGEEAFSAYTAKLCVPENAVADYKGSNTKWADFTNVVAYTTPVTLTIRQAAGGAVKELIRVGESYQYTISPDEGWEVNTVTFNGTDVTKQLVDGVYRTPALTADATLSISFQSPVVAAGAPVASQARAYGANDCIVVRGAETGDIVSIYALDGRLLNTVVADGSELRIQANGNATYIVKVGDKAIKIAM